MSLAPRSPAGSQPGSGRSTPGQTAEEANGYLLLTIGGVSATQIYAGEATTLAKGEMRYVPFDVQFPINPTRASINHSVLALRSGQLPFG